MKKITNTSIFMGILFALAEKLYKKTMRHKGKKGGQTNIAIIPYCQACEHEAEKNCLMQCLYCNILVKGVKT